MLAFLKLIHLQNKSIWFWVDYDNFGGLNLIFGWKKDITIRKQLGQSRFALGVVLR